MAGGAQQDANQTGAAPLAPGEMAYDFGDFGKSQGDQFSRAATYANPTGYGQNTLADYLANLPAYQQPGGTQTNNASKLAADTAAYQKSTTDALAAERARMIAANAAAMNAYQTARGNADLRAEYQSTIDSLNAQLAEKTRLASMFEGLASSSSPSWDNGGWSGGGAAGGEVDGIRGFRRVK